MGCVTLGKRLEVDWTEEILTDDLLREVFHYVAAQLSGLMVQEHNDGRLLMLVDKSGRMLHAVYNINENNWGCFCPGALDGECAAATYARVRLMKTRAQNP